ncbi:hypothetical protein GOP47_0011412 [Adiantum capillus-veneris]|uniref:Uncharacterized protein n=1 Tax=Adiantum capillus-veneris TaxID=13818 RepID=A0A9D4USR0_ADICA|nr:hypothetical protein GOP47_0011412 [Adiantum capillus-veneris]
MSAPSSSPGASASGSVQILDISYVKPSHPTQSLHFYLPSADTFFKSIGYVRDVLFYSAPGDENPSFSIPALKHGLSTALVDFYPVAGRLFEDFAAGSLTIDCNDAGIEFVEAIADYDFCELEKKGFPILDFYGGLTRFSHVVGHPPDAPLLSIQVTHFRDGGGVAIGFAASHVVFDGHSLWYFLNSWGQCCRGQGVSTPPLLVRALLKHACWLNSSEVPKVDSFPMNIVLPTHGPAKGYHRVMHFSSNVVQQLKETAVEESGNKSISSFQAVMACVWKRITAAQDLQPDQKMCINFAGDVRQRLRPSLTKAYFGNAVEPVYVYATAADLSKEGIGTVATRMNESLKVLEDQAFLMERLKINREEEFQAVLDEAMKGSTKFLFLTHGSKFPVYDVDVGMGRPVAVRPPTIYSDGIVYVYPSRERGGIDICVFFASLQILNAFLAIPAPCMDI